MSELNVNQGSKNKIGDSLFNGYLSVSVDYCATCFWM